MHQRKLLCVASAMLGLSLAGGALAQPDTSTRDRSAQRADEDDDIEFEEGVPQDEADTGEPDGYATVAGGGLGCTISPPSRKQAALGLFLSAMTALILLRRHHPDE